MPKKDDVYVLDADSILTVRDPDQPKRPSRTIIGEARPTGSATAGASYQARYAPRTGSWQPVVAASLSFFVCGAGQALNGQRQLGALFFTIELLVAAIHWSVAAMWEFLLEMAYIFEVTEQQMVTALAVMDGLFLLFVLANIWQAWRAATVMSGGVGGIGSPAISALASALLPGLGQLCNAQVGKALFFFFCIHGSALGSASLFVDPFATWYREVNLIGRINDLGAQAVAGVVFLAGILWVMAVYDALAVARYRRVAG